MLKGVATHSGYCWRRKEDNSFKFLSLILPPPTCFQPPGHKHAYSTRTCTRVPLSSTTSSVFFQLINMTTQVTNLRWVILFLCHLNVCLDYQLGAPTVTLTKFQRSILLLRQREKKRTKEICFVCLFWQKRHVLPLICRGDKQFCSFILNLSARCGDVRSVAKLDLY